MATEPEKTPKFAAVATGLFAFFVTIAALAASAAVVALVLATRSGGGAGIARFAPIVALGGVVGAVAMSRPAADASQQVNRTRHSMTVGIITATAMTIVATLSRDLTEPSQVGPLQWTIIGVSLVVAVAAPFLARLAVEWNVAARLAAPLSEAASGALGQMRNEDPSTDRTMNTPARSWPFASRSEAVIFGLGLVLLVVGLGYLVSSGPLGHDESVYALKARSWIEDTPTTGFANYRPVGMPIVGWIVLQVSSAEVAFRIAGATLAVATIIVMWGAGRIMLSPAAGLLGAATFIASESFLRRATEFLNDVASSGLLLAAMAVVWYQFERKPRSWWVVAAAPLVAAAYYFRYGSGLGFATIAVVAAFVWHRRLGESWRQLTAAALVLFLLLVPHFLYSIDLTGGPLGVFESARTSVGGGGGGLRDYLDWFPDFLAGRFGAIIMLAGIAYTLLVIGIAIVPRRWGTRERTVIFLAVTSITLVILLGLFTHGEPRFIFLPMMLLMLLGGQAVTAVLRRLADIPRAIVIAAIGATVIYAFATGVIGMRDHLNGLGSTRQVIVDAAAEIRADAGPEDCAIHSSYSPQLTWYTACSTVTFFADPPTDLAPRSYLVLFDNGKRQPTGPNLDEELDLTTGVAVVIDDPLDRIGDARIYRFVASTE